mgnify:FL=1
MTKNEMIIELVRHGDAYIDELIQNEDFFSISDFEEAVNEQYDMLLDFLNWRKDGGTFKGEKVGLDYVYACSRLYEILK